MSVASCVVGLRSSVSSRRTRGKRRSRWEGGLRCRAIFARKDDVRVREVTCLREHDESVCCTRNKLCTQYEQTVRCAAGGGGRVQKPKGPSENERFERVLALEGGGQKQKTSPTGANRAGLRDSRSDGGRVPNSHGCARDRSAPSPNACLFLRSHHKRIVQ